ncbi:uncharacterized protein HMPREF1541_07378 [Cyphellophora europaea CBS 101466]|uniref:RGS domain-containing protein n=1 Tax=Cyphellophora europaea (strain CBS 101466) TaxID=1220924 RepID=W2RN39_CYPE1|nr:uncharacterized protein HMPREF1541_07378 [Cyphellophora europaea CBS 101466]ETN37755.1 hypothetical protein HMPREF1541_07378 [Cyphellophora europaea CBS 101466]
MQFAKGHDMSFDYNMDGLGVIYITVPTVWTVALVAGSIFLFRNRDLPALRIRNIPLCVGGVATLHVYLFLCMIAYVLNGNFPCATEFWIMSIYLPLGIALYHASNTQLLHVAMLQKKFAPKEGTGNSGGSDAKKPAWRILVQKLRDSGPTKRTLHLIGIGMIAQQFFFVLIVFLISKKFHDNFGLVEWVNKPTDYREQASQCRKGWEWWPSIAWQFAWSWIYAPYLLYKVRSIKDTHGWRLQTACTCIAGLPASPMWLAALYLPAMAPSTKTFVPPLWFAPSIILMQGFVIFVPCYQVFKNRRLENETRQIIAEWEHKKKYGSTYSSDSTKAGSKWSSSDSARSFKSTRNPELYTLSSLEKCLQLNPKPLLLFAALKDFSGENISFLTHVHEWKTGWAVQSPVKANFLRKTEIRPTSDRLRRQQYNLAVRIYSSFVSIRYSDFPINISSAHLRELEALFAGAAAKINNHAADNAATPFADCTSRSTDMEHGLPSETLAANSHAMVDIMPSAERKHYSQIQAVRISFDGNLPEDIEVPAEFCPGTFDRVEASIRELVLTNTWPKFVNAGFAENVEKPTLKARVEGCFGEVGDMVSKAVSNVSPKRKSPRCDHDDGEMGGTRSSSDEQKLVG